MSLFAGGNVEVKELFAGCAGAEFGGAAADSMAKADAKGNSSASWAQAVSGIHVTCVYGVALNC